MLLSRVLAGMSAIALLVIGAGLTYGQDYPNKPVHIMTGSVGGGNDTISRAMAPALQQGLGQPVIVDNRPPIIASETVAKAPADGYTLMVHGAAVWLLPLLQKTNYEASDFTGVTQISRDVFILAVHPSIPAKTVQEFVALAKARPGQINYSATTPGGSVSLTAALLKSMAGINMVGVPYTGNGPALTGILSGETQLMILEAGLLLPHIKAGKLRGLAVTSSSRSALAPELPTVGESGVPGYEATGITAMFVPAKTPAAIINRVNQEAVRYLNRPEVKAQFLAGGSEVVANTPDQFNAVMKADFARWEKVIKEMGIKAN